MEERPSHPSRVSRKLQRSNPPATLDANSPTFEDDFSYVFEKNVAKARKENKRVLGVADLSPAKR